MSEVTQDEFVARFVAEMVRVGGERFSDGESIRDYATDTAKTYFDDFEQRLEGPEECARADISYWGDE